MKNSNIEYLYNHYKYIDSYISVLELMREDKREVIKKWVNIKAIIYCEYSNMDIVEQKVFDLLYKSKDKYNRDDIIKTLKISKNRYTDIKNKILNNDVVKKGY